MVGSGLGILLLLGNSTSINPLRTLAFPTAVSATVGIFFGVLFNKSMPASKPPDGIQGRDQEIPDPEMKKARTTLLLAFGAIYVFGLVRGLVTFWHANPSPLSEFVFFITQSGVLLLTWVGSIAVFDRKR